MRGSVEGDLLEKDSYVLQHVSPPLRALLFLLHHCQLITDMQCRHIWIARRPAEA